MSTEALPRPRPRFLNRIQCSRSGHRWERQILDSGAEARWVCSACGKLGDAIPVITPDQEVVEVTDEQKLPAAADDQTAQDAEQESPELGAPSPEEAAEDVPDVVSVAPDDEPAARRLGRNPVLTAAVAVTAVALVSGLTVFALRRRR